MWYNSVNERPRAASNSRGHGQPVWEVIMSIIPQKRCPKCGVEKPLSEYGIDRRTKSGYTCQCRECRAIRAKRYYHDDPERAARNLKRWIENNKERRKIQQAAWYLRNQEQEKDRARSWRQNNPDRLRAQFRAYRKAKPDKLRTIAQRRRARKYEQGGSYTEQEWVALKAQYGYTCLRCGRCEPEITLTADHVIPIARGGSSFIDNIQPLCMTCNQSKSVRTIDYRLDSRGDGR